MLRKEYGEWNRIPGSIRLQSSGSRWAFALFILLISSGFCWEAARVWIAAEFAASAEPQLWRRAAQWEPTNAAYWAQLGSIEEWDLEGADLEQAAADYERAVEVNPHSDRDWLELAGVYERQGRTSRALAAYGRAQYNHPISSVVAWRYGNFLLRQGNASEACGQFRKALATSPELTEDTLAEWWKTGLYTSQPIANILPPQNRYYFEALDYFGRQGERDAVVHIWDELLMLRQHFELPQAISAINDAISADRVSDAQRMWLQALEVSEWPREAKEDSSLIFNGGFEHDFVNGGFDWREQKSVDTSFVFDTEVAHSGARSLRATFSGRSNLDFQQVLQYVAVEPGHRYKFQAYLKSSALSTDSGMRFLLADTRQPAMLPVFTDAVAGTQPWTRLETEIVTGSETRLVSIVLRRTPGLKFDNKLSGTVWVDDVSLVAIAANDKDRHR